MLLSEAVDQIALLMGHRTDLVAKATTQLDRAQQQLEKGATYPWFLISELAEIRTEIGEQRIPVPGDYIGQVEDGFLQYQSDDATIAPVPLVKMSREIQQSIYALGTGEPKAYAKSGLYYTIYPIPDKLYKLQMRYYKKDKAISTLAQNETNLWLTHGHDCLIGKAGQKLAISYRDWGAKDEFAAIEAEGRVLLKMQDVVQEIEDEELIMGGDII